MRLIARILLGLIGLVLLLVVVIDFMPTRWLTDRIEAMASERLGARLTIDELAISLLDTTPGVTVEGVALTADADAPLFEANEALVAISLAPLLIGNLEFDRISLTDADVRWAVDENGRPNWQPVLDSLPAAPEEEPPAEQESIDIPTINALRVNGLRLTVDERVRDIDAELTVSANGSSAYPAQPTVLDINGAINEVPLDVASEFGSLAGIAWPPQRIDVDLDASAGDMTLLLDGAIGQPEQPEDFDLEFSFESDGLDTASRLSGIELPQVPPFDLSGQFTLEGSEYVLRDLKAQLQGTDLGGDVRVDTTTEPLTVFANLITRTLDLDELLAVADNLGEPTDEPEADPASEDGDAGGPLLSSETIDLKAMTGAVQGAIEYRAGEVRWSDFPLEAFDVRAEIDEGALSAVVNSLGLAGGTIEAEANVDVAADPLDGVVEMRIREVDIRRIVRSFGVSDDSFGHLGGQAKFWVDGNTPAALAGSLDGGISLLVTEGRVDSLITELAGIDIFESLGELIDPESTRTDLRCAYVDLQSDSGQVDINHFVIDTDDTVFRVSGQISLDDEQLDIVFEPRPKDPSLLAAPTSVNIGGTFAEPSITPGSELVAKAVASAALAAVATPAAALLPFIQGSRGDDSPVCTGFIEQEQ